MGLGMVALPKTGALTSNGSTGQDSKHYQDWEIGGDEVTHFIHSSKLNHIRRKQTKR